MGDLQGYWRALIVWKEPSNPRRFDLKKVYTEYMQKLRSRLRAPVVVPVDWMWQLLEPMICSYG